MNVYDLFNTVSGLNISSDNEADFLAQVSVRINMSFTKKKKIYYSPALFAHYIGFNIMELYSLLLRHFCMFMRSVVMLECVWVCGWPSVCLLLSLQIHELEKMNEDHVQKRSKKACTNTCENGPPLLNEDD